MKKIPVSTQKNLWFDGQAVDNSNLSLEQNYNDTVQSDIIDNHFGTGVLEDTLQPVVLFDSSDPALQSIGYLDGKALTLSQNVLDTNYGNQIQLECINTLVAGNKTIKVCLIGLDFENNLQYETFTFHTNEIKISEKHYISLLLVLLNDFNGNPAVSFNLAGEGKLLISQAKSLNISNQALTLSQNIEPNIFFRDFYTDGNVALNTLLQTALPQYDVSSLDIKTVPLKTRSLLANDTMTQIGQKFQATSDNIQKITLLLAVSENPVSGGLIWTGNLVVSIYSLQSSVNCYNDIVPNLAIDFPPNAIPLAQLTTNYTLLSNNGIVLDSNFQPVDFVFSNTQIASGTIVPGNYYAVVVKRDTNPTNANIDFAVGTNISETSVLTTFDGTTWTNYSESLWFELYSDSVKTSDGQAYDAGHGIIVPKTKLDATTGITNDYCLKEVSFKNNNIWYAWLKAITENSTLAQNERTGDEVYSRQQFVPSLSLINSTSLSTLTSSSNPLLLGTVVDKNIKSNVDGYYTSNLTTFSFAKNELVVRIFDDEIGDRNNTSLVSDFNAGYFTNAKFYPDQTLTSNYFRVAKAELVEMVHGDINGDGVVDELDLIAIDELIDTDFTNPWVNFNKTPNNLAKYQSFTEKFVAESPLSFTTYLTEGGAPGLTGVDGIIAIQASYGDTIAHFNSISVNFTTLTSSVPFLITITGGTNVGNNGTYKAISVIDSNNILIEKVYYTGNTILQFFRASLDGYSITNTDRTAIENYVNKVSPFPDITSKVGSKFKCLRFVLEQYNDRHDDYTSNVLTRASTIHLPVDIYTSTSTLQNKTFYNGSIFSPITFKIEQKFFWEDWLITVNANPLLVSANYVNEQTIAPPRCELQGEDLTTQPIPNEFLNNKNDLFIPDNLIIGNGNLLNKDGYFYKVDFETATFVLEIPAINFYDGYAGDGYGGVGTAQDEKSFNVFTDLVANFTGDGRTRLGYQAARFSDCSFVELNALDLNQIRFNVSIQSYSPYITDPLGGVIDGRMGVYLDQGSGLLTLYFNNLYIDPNNLSLRTRVQITVYLKKSGFNNKILTIGTDVSKNLLGLVP